MFSQRGRGTVRLELFLSASPPGGGRPPCYHVTGVEGLDGHMSGHQGHSPEEAKVQPTFSWGNVLWARKTWVEAAKVMTFCPSLAIF